MKDLEDMIEVIGSSPAVNASVKAAIIKRAHKPQVFCADCGVRLSDSIYQPALSRRERGKYPSGQPKPKKYVCHECSIMQAFGGVGGQA